MGGFTKIPRLKTNLGLEGEGDRFAKFDEEGNLVGYVMDSDVGGNGNSGGNATSNYSLRETVIGKWLGYNLYRRCFEINIESLALGEYNGTTEPYLFNHDCNIKNIKKGYIINDSNIFFQNKINFNDIIFTDLGSNYLKLEALEGLTDNWIMVIEYTKKTD